ncbi:MAG: hypothetical protein MUD01_02165 [Chloroflexaceae bacterium]|jgi:hypothetical protein|nr:hypothetical protein [Chloroflexaceae bacterium]
MVNVDTTHWPLLHIIYPDVLTEADVDTYTEAMDAALARGEPFAVSLTVTDAYFEQERNTAVSNKSMKWLKQAKPALSEHCRGMALVVPSEERRAQYGPTMEKTGPHVYGCPVAMFLSHDEAVAWMDSQLALPDMEA